MSRIREPKTKRGVLATTKIRPLEETLEWIRESFAQALTRNDVSTRRLSRLIGVHADSTADWESGETPTNVAQVLRDPTIAHHFLICLAKHERDKRRAERRRRR